ncbi:hypothetical protein ACK1JC_10450 [Acinetobacter sp. TY2]|uniref:hypothetical protein n=1 Tax=Acinetobacter sp. TY2 TaxID=3387403 RepID=UPI003917978F
MKKLLIALALTISSATYAATDTRAIRTSTDVVSIGDSPNSMIQKLGRPEASNEYTTRDRNGKLLFVIDYNYTIGNLKYTITVVEGRITNMSWER